MALEYKAKRTVKWMAEKCQLNHSKNVDSCLLSHYSLDCAFLPYISKLFPHNITTVHYLHLSILYPIWIEEDLQVGDFTPKRQHWKTTMNKEQLILFVFYAVLFIIPRPESSKYCISSFDSNSSLDQDGINNWASTA